MSGDTYTSFAELSSMERERVDYRIVRKEGASGVALLSPHGGAIEPGTAEIAEAVAAGRHSFYAFLGLKKKGNRVLHITSTNFDEPAGIEMACRSERVVTIHGCAGQEMKVYIGGLDRATGARIAESLTTAGFSVAKHRSRRLQGVNPENICNRSLGQMGVQLELSLGLRAAMFRDLTPEGRSHPTELFYSFVNALREALG